MTEKCTMMEKRLSDFGGKIGEFGARIDNLEDTVKATQGYAYDAKISAEKTSVSIDTLIKNQSEMWGHIDTCSNKWANWKGIILGVGFACTAIGTLAAFAINHLITGGK